MENFNFSMNFMNNLQNNIDYWLIKLIKKSNKRDRVNDKKIIKTYMVGSMKSWVMRKEGGRTQLKNYQKKKKKFYKIKKL